MHSKANQGLQRKCSLWLLWLFLLILNRQAEAFNVLELSKGFMYVSNKRAIHFGYSVLLQENESGKKLIVGAPKDYSNKHKETSSRPRDGAVYKCNLDLERARTLKKKELCTTININPAARPQKLIYSCNFENNTNLEYLPMGDMNWTKTNLPTPSNNTGPNTDHTFQVWRKGYFLYLETSLPHGADNQFGLAAMASTPIFQATSGACVRFWYHMHGDTTGSLNVYLYTNASGLRMIWNQDGDQKNVWRPGYITVIAEENYKIIFEAIRGVDWTGDIAIDDINITEGQCTEDLDGTGQSVGGSVAMNPQTGEILTCAPNWRHNCSGNMQVTGLCYLLDNNLTMTDQSILSPSLKQVCNTGQLDLIFLIDESSTVLGHNFINIRYWLRNIISSLPIGKEYIQVGVAVFNADPRVIFHLNEFHKIQDFREALNRAQYRGGGTGTGKAIDYITKQMFSPENGMRKNAKHVAVVITDGKSNDDVTQPARNAKGKGISIIAIGVGSEVVKSELIEIASNIGSVYSESDYVALEAIRGQIKQSITALESQGKTYTTEQSQAGFCSTFHNDDLILGLPGLNDWSGGYATYSIKNTPLQMPVRTSFRDLLTTYQNNKKKQQQKDKSNSTEPILTTEGTMEIENMETTIASLVVNNVTENDVTTVISPAVTTESPQVSTQSLTIPKPTESRQRRSSTEYEEELTSYEYLSSNTMVDIDGTSHDPQIPEITDLDTGFSDADSFQTTTIQYTVAAPHNGLTTEQSLESKLPSDQTDKTNVKEDPQTDEHTLPLITTKQSKVRSSANQVFTTPLPSIVAGETSVSKTTTSEQNTTPETTNPSSQAESAIKQTTPSEHISSHKIATTVRSEVLSDVTTASSKTTVSNEQFTQPQVNTSTKIAKTVTDTTSFLSALPQNTTESQTFGKQFATETPQPTAAGTNTSTMLPQYKEKLNNNTQGRDFKSKNATSTHINKQTMGLTQASTFHLSLEQQTSDNKMTILKRSISPTNKNRKKRSLSNDTENADLITEMLSNAYFGYAVASGRVISPDQVDLIVAAPRMMSKGSVFVVRTSNFTGSIVKDTILREHHGKQMGSYFGYSLCVTDTNGDGIDDLFVGAPLWFDKLDNEGRVFVYMSGIGKNVVAPQPQEIVLMGLAEKGSRFGFSMAAVGDLNKDGYNDLVVGAPSTASGDGAIYIYNGRPDIGITAKHTQVIKSSQKKKNRPVYFGFALSGGIDIDNNGYNDIAVGAPGNDRVAILLSKPVIHTKMTLQAYPSVFNLSTHNTNYSSACDGNGTFVCSNVTACFYFYGTNISSRISINYALQPDVGSLPYKARGRFSNEKGKIMMEIHKTTCVSSMLLIKLPVRNQLLPMTVVLTYSTIGKKMPLLDIFDAKPLQTNITFSNECTNGTCKSDVKTQCTTHGKQLPPNQLKDKIVIDVNKMIAVDVNVTNLVKTAYDVQMEVEFNSSLYLIRVAPKNGQRCMLNLESGLISEKQSPQSNADQGVNKFGLQYKFATMGQGETCLFTLQFGVKDYFKGGKVNVKIITVTSNTEVDTSNNDCDVNMNVAFESGFNIYGKSHTDQTTFSRKNETNIISFADIGPEVWHLYNIYNTGPSTIPNMSLTVKWPTETKSGHDILYLYTVVCDPLSACMCKDTDILINSEHINETGQLEVSTNRGKGPIDFGHALSNAKTDSKTKKEFHETSLSCRSNKVVCETLFCDFTNLKPSKSATLKLGFRIWKHTFLAANLWKVSITSQASASVKKSQFLVSKDGQSLKDETTMVITQAFNDEFKEFLEPTSYKMNWWIYAAAASAGILILLLTILALRKAGFFKNKYRQQIEEELEWKNSFKYTAAQQAVYEGSRDQPYSGQKLSTFQRGLPQSPTL